VISDYDICIFARVDVPSTYLKYNEFSHIGKKAQVSGHLNPDLKPLYITRFVRKRYSQYIEGAGIKESPVKKSAQSI